MARRPSRRRTSSRRSYSAPRRRSSSTRRASTRRSSSPRGQTVRIVLQQAPTPSGVMVDPIAGSQLVMPGAPRPRRARF